MTRVKVQQGAVQLGVVGVEKEEGEKGSLEAGREEVEEKACTGSTAQVHHKAEDENFKLKMQKA